MSLNGPARLRFAGRVWNGQLGQGMAHLRDGPERLGDLGR